MYVAQTGANTDLTRTRTCRTDQTGAGTTDFTDSDRLAAHRLGSRVRGKAFGTAATRNGSEIGYETQSRTEREASRSKSRTRLFIGVIRSHTSMVSQERSAHSHLTEFEFAQTTCHSMSSSSQRSASESAGSEFESSSSRVALSGGTPPPHLPSNFRGRPRPRNIPSGLGVTDFLT